MNAQHEANFDLNQPGEALQDDLGVVDNQAVQMEEPMLEDLVEEDVIVASSDSEGQNVIPDAMSNPVLPDLNVNVDVFIPMEDGVPLQLIPNEIHEEDLIPEEADANAALVNVEIQQPAEDPDAMHLGFVTLPEDQGDPVFIERIQQNLHSEFFKHNPDVVRLWARFLAPGPGAQSVQVPKVWADFFTTLLLNPGSFEWAKSMLQSQAWNLFQTSCADSVPFCLPAAKLADNSLLCDTHAVVTATSTLDYSQAVEDSSHDQFCVTPLEKISAKVAATPGPWSQQLLDLAAQNEISEQALSPASRRSACKKEQLKGFKGSSCANKNCLGCAEDPPTISPSIIRNLGASFCKVDVEKLSVEALSKKAKVATPSGKEPKKPPAKINPVMMFQSLPRRSQEMSRQFYWGSIFLLA